FVEGNKNVSGIKPNGIVDDVINNGNEFNIVSGSDESPSIELTAKGIVELIINACAKISKVNYFGATMTVNVLRGSKNQQVINYKLNELDCYGALRSIKAKQVFDIVEFLIEKNYLYRTQGLYPTVRVNAEKSIANLQNTDLSILEEIIALNNTNVKPQIQTVENVMTIVVEGWEVYIDEDGELLTDIKLLKRLQLLRRKIGDGRNIAYYLIASNKLLVRLATNKPTTREEFLAIKGIRYRWFDKYGQAFMNEIKEYLE
ncbi:MAG: HRDC domain-containing protein, partial [Clostridia bacterium]|nr:HRDC domain-containing protein [Clostridia bacterium]